MGWKFWGYAAVYGSPDNHGDIFMHQAFYEFLKRPDHLEIPMLMDHQGEPIGRWLRMVDTPYGLLVWGQLNADGIPMKPGDLAVGLSVNPTDSKVPSWQLNTKNLFGGNICTRSDLAEISIVKFPTHPGARILGEWKNL